MNAINEAYQSLSSKASDYFTLEIDAETGTPNIVAGTVKAHMGFGAVAIIDYQVVPSSESPFDMFNNYSNLFDSTKEAISNNLLGTNPDIEAKINTGSYNLLSSQLTKLAYSNSVISSWYDAEEEQTYVLVLSTSEEEGYSGYLGMIFLCKLDSA